MYPNMRDRETLPSRLLNLRDSDNYCTELVTTEGVEELVFTVLFRYSGIISASFWH